MLKKLRRKFVLLTTAISIAVMLLIAVTINIANYRSVVATADAVINLLAQGELLTAEDFLPRYDFPRELAYTTRFFSVHTDSDDNINAININNISYVTLEDAADYFDEMFRTNQNYGTVGNFRFAKIQNPAGTSYYFLDIEEDLMAFETYLLYSVLVVLGAVVLIFLLSVLFSKTALSPILQSYERQKRFITDVSHELKTPLAIIKADCEVLEIDGGEGEWTSSIKRQTDRLNAMVESLVTLSKLDEEQRKLDKTDFSLSDTAHDVVQEFFPTLHSRGLTFNVAIQQNLMINAEEKSVRTLLSILTENAVKYAPDNSVIDISLTQKGNKKIFIVKNPCDKISVGKHNRLFDRFYRQDESRNSENKGFGIGLSIAKAICDNHAASITAESLTGKDMVFTVKFNG